jgi:hypothetical protein
VNERGKGRLGGEQESQETTRRERERDDRRGIKEAREDRGG